MTKRLLLCAAFAAALPAAALGQPKPEGYLCCNMRTDGSWISDINYSEAGKRIIPVGTPLKVTGYGRQRVHVEIDGQKQSLGNDYSRELSLPDFAQRYVVAEDPSVKIAGFHPKIADAIKQAKLVTGMTREQVLMAVGYPVTSENPDLTAKIWRFWFDSFSEFQVVFNESGRVKEIVTDPKTANLVVAD